MKIGISGSTGFIGSKLRDSLLADGHGLVHYIRSASNPLNLTADEKVVLWDCLSGPPEPGSVDGLDAFVHLAGEPIAAKRWTKTQKSLIRDSRVIGTRNLVEGFRNALHPPQTLLSGSAIGIYGNRGTEQLDESSSPGDGFLAEVCRMWEEEALRARSWGIRVALLRTGLVLSADGGALARMLLPFRLGLGGRLGSGKQYMSWIHIHDHVKITRAALTHESYAGPLNLTAPRPVTNSGFTKALSARLRRPGIMAAPGLLLRLALGEMGKALLLEGQRVVPAKAESLGYSFQFPELGNALKDLLR